METLMTGNCSDNQCSFQHDAETLNKTLEIVQKKLWLVPDEKPQPIIILNVAETKIESTSYEVHAEVSSVVLNELLAKVSPVFLPISSSINTTFDITAIDVATTVQGFPSNHCSKTILNHADPCHSLEFVRNILLCFRNSTMLAFSKGQMRHSLRFQNLPCMANDRFQIWDPGLPMHCSLQFLNDLTSLC